VVIATKAAEIVVGPELAARAAERGAVHSPVDGDQPSLPIGLVGWARMLGLPVICAGKASESDFVWDPQAGTGSAWGLEEPAGQYAQCFAGALAGAGTGGGPGLRSGASGGKDAGTAAAASDPASLDALLAARSALP